MIERKFEAAERSKPVGFSHGDFRFVVQALDDSAGKQLLGAEIVEDQFAVLAQRAGDFLHRLDAGAHHLTAPFVEELPRPGGGVVVPELLKGFLTKVGADGPQVVAEEVAQPEALLSVRER